MLITIVLFIFNFVCSDIKISIFAYCFFLVGLVCVSIAHFKSSQCRRYYNHLYRLLLISKDINAAYNNDELVKYHNTVRPRHKIPNMLLTNVLFNFIFNFVCSDIKI